MTKGKANKILRIASYNIRKSVGLDWKRDSARILEVLREIDADIIALQEADKRLGERPGTLSESGLKTKLGYQFADLDMNAVSHGWHGNAILYRAPFKLISCERIEIPNLEPRGAICGTFTSASGSKFSLIGTHLSLLGRMRASQVEFLSRIIKSNAVKTPAIIAGDFNEWHPKGKAYRAVGDGFEIITPGPSFHSSKPVAALDRFVISDDLVVVNSHVHTTALSKKASDHLPIVMDVTFKDLSKRKD